MQNVRKLTQDVYFIGAEDDRIQLFENMFPLERGVSYNSYLVMDEKTIVFDTVDYSVGLQFIENIKNVLGEKPLDYLVISHMEPDHCAYLQQIVNLYPEVTIVGNTQTFKMIDQFFDVQLTHKLIVKEYDTLCTGVHTFTFIMAPFVHWPEVMVAYDAYDKILYSADAFGTFNTLDGAVFDDEVCFEKEYMDEARRYYTNIVGKYGMQVQTLLKKASALDIQMIAPLHGVVFRKEIPMILEKYQKWSTYTAEEKGVLIVCGSIYGNTLQAMRGLASCLHEKGNHAVKLVNVSRTHPSYIIADMFKYSHIVFATPTYNAGVFPLMETLLQDMCMLQVQNKKIVLIDNGTWAPLANTQMIKKLGSMKNMECIYDAQSIKSSLKDISVLENIADALITSMKDNT